MFLTASPQPETSTELPITPASPTQWVEQVFLIHKQKSKCSNVCRKNTYSACIFRPESLTQSLDKPNLDKSESLVPEADAAVTKTGKGKIIGI